MSEDQNHATKPPARDAVDRSRNERQKAVLLIEVSRQTRAESVRLRDKTKSTESATLHREIKNSQK
jgi:hypothetical protein